MKVGRQRQEYYWYFVYGFRASFWIFDDYTQIHKDKKDNIWQHLSICTQNQEEYLKENDEVW